MTHKYPLSLTKQRGEFQLNTVLSPHHSQIATRLRAERSQNWSRSGKILPFWSISQRITLYVQRGFFLTLSVVYEQ